MWRIASGLRDVRRAHRRVGRISGREGASAPDTLSSHIRPHVVLLVNPYLCILASNLRTRGGLANAPRMREYHDVKPMYARRTGRSPSLSKAPCGQTHVREEGWATLSYRRTRTRSNPHTRGELGPPRTGGRIATVKPTYARRAGDKRGELRPRQGQTHVCEEGWAGVDDGRYQDTSNPRM